MPRSSLHNTFSLLATNPHVLGLLALLLAWLLCFWPTLHSMVEIWQRSDTYAHGFLIFPISLFLIWRKRTQLAVTGLNSSNLALLPLLLLILGWFFADAVAVNVFKQLSVVLMLPMLVWLSCGWNILRLLLFPFAYLIFAVPMGDGLVAPMQNITADITVYALQLSNIPVFRDGLYLATPTGMFLVAEACSGVRYLIASFALGTLYAYLNYQSRLKQLLFCLFAIVLPILANGIRAYGIVLVAHLTDMQHAVGVDHLIYGWLFFGLLMFFMFYIGSFWADSTREPFEVNHASSSGAPARSSLFGILILLLPTAAPHLLPPLSSTAVYDVKALAMLLEPDEHPQHQPAFMHSSDHLSGIWVLGESPILFYAAFYQHTDQQKLVSWHNQPYQRNHWTPASQRKQQLLLPDKTLGIQEVDLRATDGRKRLLWYWYGSGDFFSANPYLITAMQAVGKVFHISQHGSFFAISINYDVDINQARSQLTSLLEQKFPLLRQANAGTTTPQLMTAQERKP